VIDLINAIVLILNLLSTWRAAVSVAVAIATAFAASLLMPSGRTLAITVYAVLILGVSIGLLWQYRHEKRIKSAS
jgi:hypothetical protein